MFTALPCCDKILRINFEKNENISAKYCYKDNNKLSEILPSYHGNYPDSIAAKFFALIEEYPFISFPLEQVK